MALRTCSINDLAVREQRIWMLDWGCQHDFESLLNTDLTISRRSNKNHIYMYIYIYIHMHIAVHVHWRVDILDKILTELI